MKKRLDVLLVERGLATSREKAKAMIMSREDLVKSRRLENRAAAHARLSNEAASDMIGLEKSIGGGERRRGRSTI